MTENSEKPLAQKLGIKRGMTVVMLNMPDGYKALLGELQDVKFTTRFDQPTGFVHFFSTTQAELARILPTLKRQIVPNGMLWVSWPKRGRQALAIQKQKSGDVSSSREGTVGIKTDLDEHVVRAVGLRNGLVDVKVCAIDDTWSALKFMFRKEDRK